MNAVQDEQRLSGENGAIPVPSPRAQRPHSCQGARARGASGGTAAPPVPHPGRWPCSRPRCWGSRPPALKGPELGPGVLLLREARAGSTQGSSPVGRVGPGGETPAPLPVRPWHMEATLGGSGGSNPKPGHRVLDPQLACLAPRWCRPHTCLQLPPCQLCPRAWGTWATRLILSPVSLLLVRPSQRAAC